MNELFEKLRAGNELANSDVAAFCAILFDESRPVEGRADLLHALSAKGETPAEMASFVRTLLAHSKEIAVRESGAPLMDVCGTGGDKQSLFNISTAVMFVAAACGVRVAKQGNRGMTTKTGSADVLEALGIRIDLEPAHAADVLDDVGCVFLFAPSYYPAFRAVSPVRKLLASRGEASIFNKIAPLLNPTKPPYQLAGVFAPEMTAMYGAIFLELGRVCAWAVHGCTPFGGLDKMSILGSTKICALEHGRIAHRSLDSADYGIRTPELADLQGGDAGQNAIRLEALLRGPATDALADMVSWNTAGALVVAGVCADMGEGLDRAREAIRSGEAAARLDAMRAATAVRTS